MHGPARSAQARAGRGPHGPGRGPNKGVQAGAYKYRILYKYGILYIFRIFHKEWILYKYGILCKYSRGPRKGAQEGGHPHPRGPIRLGARPGRPGSPPRAAGRPGSGGHPPPDAEDLLAAGVVHGPDHRRAAAVGEELVDGLPAAHPVRVVVHDDEAPGRHQVVDVLQRLRRRRRRRRRAAAPPQPGPGAGSRAGSPPVRTRARMQGRTRPAPQPARPQGPRWLPLTLASSTPPPPPLARLYRPTRLGRLSS